MKKLINPKSTTLTFVFIEIYFKIKPSQYISLLCTAQTNYLTIQIQYFYIPRFTMNESNNNVETISKYFRQNHNKIKNKIVNLFRIQHKFTVISHSMINGLLLISSDTVIINQPSNLIPYYNILSILIFFLIIRVCRASIILLGYILRKSS